MASCLCREARLCPVVTEGEQTAAHPEAQKRDADRHEGEVMPLDDGKEPDQKHLEGQDRRRDDGEREANTKG